MQSLSLVAHPCGRDLCMKSCPLMPSGPDQPAKSMVQAAKQLLSTSSQTAGTERQCSTSRSRFAVAIAAILIRQTHDVPSSHMSSRAVTSRARTAGGKGRTDEVEACVHRSNAACKEEKRGVTGEG